MSQCYLIPDFSKPIVCTSVVPRPVFLGVGFMIPRERLVLLNARDDGDETEVDMELYVKMGSLSPELREQIRSHLRVIHGAKLPGQESDYSAK